MRNNAKFFATPDHFIRLIPGETNNVIELGYLDHGVPADVNVGNNRVYCSFRGIDIEQVAVSELDVEENVNKFAYETLTGSNRNVIKIAVDKLEIDTPDKARKYITGLWVDYQLEDIVYANTAQTPLYHFRAYLSDGTLVSLSEACSMDSVRKKMDALDKDAAINAIGFNEYYIRRATAKR